jgi:hypothetical protein
MEKVQWTFSPTNGCTQSAPRRDVPPKGVGWFEFNPRRTGAHKDTTPSASRPPLLV